MSPASLEVKDFNLFQTVVTVISPHDSMLNFLNTLDPILESLKISGEISKYEKATLRNGWRIENPHSLPEFSELKRHLNSIVKTFSNLKRIDLGSSWIISSWLNVHEAHGFNLPHHHGSSIMSGVFYLRVPPGSGRIVFKDPRPGALFSENSYSGVPPVVALNPEEGMTVVFPGFVEHYVEESSFRFSGNFRASVAFNVAKTVD